MNYSRYLTLKKAIIPPVLEFPIKWKRHKINMQTINNFNVTKLFSENVEKNLVLDKNKWGGS